MSKRPKFVVQLVMDVAALLVYAMFTFSMVATCIDMETREFRAFTLLLAAGGLYFTIRAAINLRHTLAGTVQT